MATSTVEERLARGVHRHSPAPLHHQIKVAVLQGIEQGWLSPGSQLPRERRLAEALGVSLAPVRQAMVDLTKEGYVDRTRGKGTFVRERKLVEKIQILGSFHGSMREQGLAPVGSGSSVRPCRRRPSRSPRLCSFAAVARPGACAGSPSWMTSRSPC